ncbi:MAG: FAD-binding oxidoreductase, partial [Planctomycetes bacterium]|nr:FAD-binding oxidoreductase [Planctomycetota bacterium]
MTEAARVVVIGGGVAGCGLAYHLAALGWTDVLLLEKNELTAGATWHAAGHVMHYASSALLTRLQKETTDFLPKLEAETGQSVGFHRTGALRLITSDEQLVEYRRAVAKATALGMEMDIIPVEEACRHFPLMRREGLRGALWTPGDGHVDPSGVAFAYARGARTRGARIRVGCQVTGMAWNGSEWRIETTAGPVVDEYVVNCAGMWARQLGEASGVNVPLQAAEHYYLITEAMPEIRRDFPV